MLPGNEKRRFVTAKVLEDASAGALIHVPAPIFYPLQSFVCPLWQPQGESDNSLFKNPTDVQKYRSQDISHITLSLLHPAKTVYSLVSKGY